MSNGNGHHWSKFCWRDHMADPALCDCSLAAKGFWIGILALMHESTPVGHLAIDGKPVTISRMASYVRCTVRQAEKALGELETAGVFSRTPDGTIYSRRMVRDAEAADAARTWGRAGGNPNLKPKPNGATHDPPKPGGVNPPVNAEGYPPPNPTPLTLPLTEGVNGGVIPRTRTEKETEVEVEKKVSVFSNLPSSSSVLARVAAACETPPVGTFGAEPDQEPVSTARQIEAQNLLGKVVRKLDCRTAISQPTGRRPKLTVVEQIAAVLHGPVLDDAALEGEILEPPIRRGPVDPQRTVAEQLAALGYPEMAMQHAEAVP